MIVCEICKKEFKKLNGFSQHLGKQFHHLSLEQKQQYYDKYFLKKSKNVQFVVMTENLKNLVIW